MSRCLTYPSALPAACMSQTVTRQTPSKLLWFGACATQVWYLQLGEGQHTPAVEQPFQHRPLGALNVDLQHVDPVVPDVRHQVPQGLHLELCDVPAHRPQWVFDDHLHPRCMQSPRHVPAVCV